MAIWIVCAAILVLVQTGVGEQVYLELGYSGIVISNNSEFPISYIGYDYYRRRLSGYEYYERRSVTCHTGTVDVGVWFYPNGTEVTSSSSGQYFYTTSNGQRITLYYRGNIKSPTGLYCCVVPTTVGQQRLCVYLTDHTVYLSLGTGNIITTNNTVLSITDIGQDDPDGLPRLTCHTDVADCCRNADAFPGTTQATVGGEWYYPDGTQVPNNAGGDYFARIKNARQVVRLYRRIPPAATSPIGLYCCVIPTTVGEQTFCAYLIPCPSLSNPTNGVVEYNSDLSSLVVNTVATYSCNYGYLLIGEGTRTCQSDGTWTSTAPHCAPLCPSLFNPINGVVEYSSDLSSLVVNTVATYSCDNGHLLLGEGTRTCQLDGTWTSIPPDCAPLCPSLFNPTNGVVEYSSDLSSLVVNTVATYSCDNGHLLLGEGTRTCQSDGTWTSTAPHCAPLCPSLFNPTNGVVEYSSDLSSLVVNTVATYSCDNGHLLLGEGTRTCQLDGTWTSIPPDCAPLCPSLPKPTNGVVEYSSDLSSLVVNTVATYSCDNGYLLIGEGTRTCQLDGTWTSIPPYCVDYTLVQLRFAPTDHCIHWNEKEASQMSLYMRTSIQEVVLTEGNQTIPLDNIEDGFFSCRTSQNWTTFRTRIIGTQTASAVEGGVYVQKWVESGATVRVQWYIVDVDKNCPVSISSMTEPECGGVDVNFQRCVDICVARGRPG